MKFWILTLAVCTCTGCTMMSLERHSVAQTGSAIDLRYHEIMDNLAMIADDPATLPAYASIFAGSISVTDQQQLVSTTMWQHVVGAPVIQNGYASEAANPLLTRTFIQNWSLDPIVIPEKLEAMRGACQWAIGGPEHVYKDSMSLLISPDQAPVGPGRHFDVAAKLQQLPEGWLNVGCMKEVPREACFKAHCGKTWVWVMPEGMKGLTDFTLIIQDIARVDSNSLSLFNFGPIYLPIRIETADSPVREDLNNPKSRQIRLTAQLYVDQGGLLIPDNPFFPLRFENKGENAKLKSALNATVTIPR